MVRFAKEQGWNEVIIVAPSFHMRRCALSAITAVLLFYPKLRVYNQVGVAQSWYEEVVHSQNVVHGLRNGLIVGELRRTIRYQRKNKWMRLVTDGFMFLKAALRSGTLCQQLRKIGQYAKQGSPVPLVSTDDALAYLEWRDGA
jgi:hypothetical protein